MQYHKRHLINNFWYSTIVFILTSASVLSLQFSSFLLYIASGIHCSQTGAAFNFSECPQLYWSGLLYVMPPLFGIWLMYKFTNSFPVVMLFISIVIVVEQVLLLKSLSDIDAWKGIIDYCKYIAESVFV